MGWFTLICVYKRHKMISINLHILLLFLCQFSVFHLKQNEGMKKKTTNLHGYGAQRTQPKTEYKTAKCNYHRV